MNLYLCDLSTFLRLGYYLNFHYQLWFRLITIIYSFILNLQTKISYFVLVIDF